MELSRFMAEWHPRLVSFPVVMLLAGLLFDAAGLIRRSERAHWTGKLLTVSGTGMLLIAFLCGINAEIWAGRSGVSEFQIEWHELVATAATWSFMALTAWRVLINERRRRIMAAYLAAGFCVYAWIAVAGYLGGKLVLENGAAVVGVPRDTAVSVHDLNTLAQRQTDLNLRVSEMNHHIAGVMLLIVSATLWIGVVAPQKADKLRWVVPTLMLLAGLAQFTFGDADLWRPLDPRQLLDREVQFHKIVALILMGLALYWLYKTRATPVRSIPAPERLRWQNQLVAVLILIGGGALFTHVHTVAPYADVAAGVYVNHMLMGMTALAIGGAKLLDDGPSPRRPGWRRLLFPSLLFVESFLLLTYNEGLPWWIGIGHYNRWGPHGGAIAPFGPVRAELAFDADTAEMNLHVLDRFSNNLVPIPTTNLVLLVSQQYDEAAVPLAAVDPTDGRAAHFRGRAVFLKAAGTFDAHVGLPVDGRWRVGWFDPWVTRAVAGIPPNEVTRYVCPMHEGIQSATQGDCPICGMKLLPIRRGPLTTLHDARYKMDLACDSSTVRAGQPVELTMTPRFTSGGQVVRNLVMMHEHWLHLIIVSDDLSYFDHVHPDLQADGSFTIRYAFPHGGRFLLFADIMPDGDWSQVFRMPIEVAGPKPEVQPVTPTPAPSRDIGPYHVEVIVQPRDLVVGRETEIGFRLSRDGQLVTDLQPYLGAMGHCAIISEDAQSFLHSHPLQFTAELSPDRRGGPLVNFHVQFPKPGLYKIWGQFRHRDKIVTVDYVVRVERPWLPPQLAKVLVEN